VGTTAEGGGNKHQDEKATLPVHAEEGAQIAEGRLKKNSFTSTKMGGEGRDTDLLVAGQKGTRRRLGSGVEEKSPDGARARKASSVPAAPQKKRNREYFADRPDRRTKDAARSLSVRLSGRSRVKVQIRGEVPVDRIPPKKKEISGSHLLGRERGGGALLTSARRKERGSCGVHRKRGGGGGGVNKKSCLSRWGGAALLATQLEGSAQSAEFTKEREEKRQCPEDKEATRSPLHAHEESQKKKREKRQSAMSLHS